MYKLKKVTEVLFSLSWRLQRRRTKEQRGKEKKKKRIPSVSERCFCHHTTRHVKFFLFVIRYMYLLIRILLHLIQSSTNDHLQLCKSFFILDPLIDSVVVTFFLFISNCFRWTSRSSMEKVLFFYLVIIIIIIIGQVFWHSNRIESKKWPDIYACVYEYQIYVYRVCAYVQFNVIFSIFHFVYIYNHEYE